MDTTSAIQSDRRTEDSLTATLENYTAAVPSSAYLGVAAGAIAASLMSGDRTGQMGKLHRAVGSDIADHGYLQQARQNQWRC
jgi:hypothetical protein